MDPTTRRSHLTSLSKSRQNPAAITKLVRNTASMGGMGPPTANPRGRGDGSSGTMQPPSSREGASRTRPTSSTMRPPSSSMQPPSSSMQPPSRSRPPDAMGAPSTAHDNLAPPNSQHTSNRQGNRVQAVSRPSDDTSGAPPLQKKYSEPSWSAGPEHDFHLEVLKSGAIIDDIPLKSNFLIVGRHPAVHLTMENPSVSRQHAVFQFSNDGCCYLFDLGSTHGTMVNKQSLTAKKYYQINVGDVIKFGSSSRLFIFQGPAELQPKEYTSDNLRQLRLKSQLRASRVSSKVKNALMGKVHDDGGAMWGFDDDAEEDDDDDYDENGNRIKKVEITREMLGPKDMKIFERLQRNRQKVQNLKIELGRIRSKEMDQGGFTEGQQNTIDRNEKHIAQLMEAMEDQESLLRERIGLRKSSRESTLAGRQKKKEYHNDEEDDDDFYDRTGQQQAKAARRQLKRGARPTTQTEALSAEDLKEKAKALEEEQVHVQQAKERLQLEQLELEQEQQEGSTDASQDPLAAYMLKTKLQANKSERERIAKREAELKVEQIRMKQLISIVAPALAGLTYVKPSSRVTDQSQDDEKDTSPEGEQANKEAPKTQKEKLLAHAVETGAVVPWIQKMAKEEHEKQEAQRAASTESARVKGTDNKFSTSKKAMAAPPSRPAATPQAGNPKQVLGPSRPPPTVQVATKHADPSPKDDAGGEEAGRRRRRRRRGKSKDMNGAKATSSGAGAPPAKVARHQTGRTDRKESSKLEGGDTAWTPPANQDGSGRTALNDKFGY